MGKTGSKLLGMLFYLYALNLRDPRTYPVRSKIDIIHIILSTLSGLLKSENNGQDPPDMLEIDNLFNQIKSLEKIYYVDLEFKDYAQEDRQEIELKIQDLFRRIMEKAIIDNLLDLSYLDTIYADMDHLKGQFKRTE